MSLRLLEILKKDNLITEAQYKIAEQETKKGGDGARLLVQRNLIPEAKILYFLSQKFNLPNFNLAKYDIPLEVHKLVDPDTVKKTGGIPLQLKGKNLLVAICDPTSIEKLQAIKLKTNLNIEPVLTTFTSFDAAVKKYYGGTAILGSVIQNFRKDQDEEAVKASKSLGQSQVYKINEDIEGNSEAPIIRVVNAILSEGITRGASDIHIEPYEKSFRVRLRIDGALHDIAQIPVDMKRAIISRFKIMSQMDISETRIPQDGRIKLQFQNAEIDFRVNSMPTLFGEKVCLRLLSKGNLQLDLTKLGFESQQLKVFQKGIYAPNGMVLVTGPTGSGKTTTLYSALSELNTITDNISTVEDPVEYNLEGVNQVQVRKDIELTFASVLRALLRQDPDTILVGEIRDLETAAIAIQAALTGHLVLSTLHTNDAPSTITRLMNMGVEEFLVVSALNTIVAQRLLRKVCTECRVGAPEQADALLKLGVPADRIHKDVLVTGKGCNKCNNSGYKGRIAVYEVLDFSETLKEMVLKKATIVELRRQAIKEGMTTLRVSAITKVLQGATSLEEALSLTME